jgi:hypothetical protein
LNFHTAAAEGGLPCSVENLDGENVRRAENAVARQHFCPLQRPEIIVPFSEFRRPSGIPAQERFADAPFVKFPLPASIRAKPRPAAGSMFDPLAAGGAGEVAGGGLVFKLRVAYTFSRHVIPVAGLARQRGPAFSLPGAG